MSLTTHPHLQPRLKKEQSYTCTPPQSLHGLLQGELYPFTFTYHLTQVFHVAPSVRFPTKTCMLFSSLPYVLHAQPMSSTLILSQNIWLPKTNCEKFRDVKYTASGRYGLLTDINAISMQRGIERHGDKESALSNWFRLRNRDGRSLLNDWQCQWHFQLLFRYLQQRWSEQRKAPINFIMSVHLSARLSVRTYHSGSQRRYFREI